MTGLLTGFETAAQDDRAAGMAMARAA